MKNRRAVLACLFLVVSTFTPISISQAAAVIKVGGTCSKAGLTSKSGANSFLCVKSGKKLIWSAVPAKKTVLPAPAPTPTPTPNPTQSTPTEIKYYVAKDQTTVQLLKTNESCSNPKNASFEIQAQVGDEWLPVRVLESGWNTSAEYCSNPLLGARNSLAWAKVYMDPGTKYRWIFSGEINMEIKDANGKGVSQTSSIPAKIIPYVNKVPITLPVPQTGSITFSNAASNYGQIPEVAWQRVQDVIAANPSVEIPTTIDIGPNTRADLATITNSLGRLYRLFAGFEQFSSYSGIVYNAKDLAWAQTDASTLFQKQGITGNLTRTESIKQQSEAGCEINGGTPVNCSGGMALTFKDGGSNAGGAFYGVENTYTANGESRDFWTASERNAGPMTQVTHEGTHNYQFAQFFHKPLEPGQNTAADQSHAFTPWWFSEGQANGIGISVFADNLSAYLSIRTQNVTRRPDARAIIPAYTAEAMKNFLTQYQSTGPSNSNWSLAYSIGYSAVEALIAIGGPQSTLALYALGGNGESWDTAFQHVYGISWDQGATILGQVLAAEYSEKPLSR